jgi:hypothetical protein
MPSRLKCAHAKPRNNYSAVSHARSLYHSSLALHGLQFVTPWITVADGKGRFLSHLELQLTAAGDALTAVRWETEYVDEAPPNHISVHTKWEHALEHDLSSALTLLFLVAGCLVAALAYFTCRKHGGSTIAKLLYDEDDYSGEPRDEGGDLHAYRTQYRHELTYAERQRQRHQSAAAMANKRFGDGKRD